MITEQRIAIYLQAASTTRVGVSGSLSYAFFLSQNKGGGMEEQTGGEGEEVLGKKGK
jgi:hypothetical protein